MSVIKGGNYKLQDYRTQLEFLEQAERKKKGEKEALTKQGSPDHPTQFDSAAVQKEPQGFDETDAFSTKPDQSIATRGQPQEVNVAQVTPMMMPASDEQSFQISRNASQDHRMHDKRWGPPPPADESNVGIHNNAFQVVTDRHFPRGINIIIQVRLGQHALGLNYALGSYQMQLMMLEQQNQKRLMHARKDASEQQLQETNANANANASSGIQQIQHQTLESSPLSPSPSPPPHHHPNKNANNDAPTEFNLSFKSIYDTSFARVHVMREISPGTYQCVGMPLDEYKKELREQQQQQQPYEGRL